MSQNDSSRQDLTREKVVNLKINENNAMNIAKDFLKEEDDKLKEIMAERLLYAFREYIGKTLRFIFESEQGLAHAIFFFNTALRMRTGGFEKESEYCHFCPLGSLLAMECFWAVVKNDKAFLHEVIEKTSDHLFDETFLRYTSAYRYVLERFNTMAKIFKEEGRKEDYDKIIDLIAALIEKSSLFGPETREKLIKGIFHLFYTMLEKEQRAKLVKLWTSDKNGIDLMFILGEFLWGVSYSGYTALEGDKELVRIAMEKIWNYENPPISPLVDSIVALSKWFDDDEELKERAKTILSDKKITNYHRGYGGGYSDEYIKRIILKSFSLGCFYQEIILKAFMSAYGWSQDPSNFEVFFIAMIPEGLVRCRNIFFPLIKTLQKGKKNKIRDAFIDELNFMNTSSAKAMLDEHLFRGEDSLRDLFSYSAVSWKKIVLASVNKRLQRIVVENKSGDMFLYYKIGAEKFVKDYLEEGMAFSLKNKNIKYPLPESDEGKRVLLTEVREIVNKILEAGEENPILAGIIDFLKSQEEDFSGLKDKKIKALFDEIIASGGYGENRTDLSSPVPYFEPW